MDDSERDIREERFAMLRESLQLLAMPAAAQLAFFPPRWVETAFELADYFIGAYRVIVNNHPKRLRADQRRRLDLLHEKLEAVVSVREEEYLRTEGALLGSTEWQDLRELAREALRSFGWPLEAPPKGRHRFIGPDGAFLPPYYERP
jgi:hypothetical protein